MRNTVAVGIRRRGRSSYVRSTGRHRKGISLLSNTNSSPKAVEASCAVCGHSPKRRGLPSAELTRKMQGPLRADCAAPPKTLLYYREREWTSKPCKHEVAPRAWP